MKHYSDFMTQQWSVFAVQYLTMTNELKPVILNSYNPNTLTPSSVAETRSLNELNEQNQGLVQLITTMRKQVAGSKHEKEELQPKGDNAEFQRRTEENSLRIKELQSLVRSQQQVLGGYRQRFKQFQDNLINIMKLDKDIHTRLVNPQSSGTLQTNVRNVLVALNGKAPYDRLIKMIESIKV